MIRLQTTGKQVLDLAQDDIISKSGMAELRYQFGQMTDHYLPRWFSNLYITNQTDPDNERTLPDGKIVPIKYSGKIAKRLAKYAIVIDKKLTKERVSDLGTLASRYKITCKSVEYDITSRFDWNSGDFGDSGSCFWSCHASARYAMQDNDYMAIRFYNGDGGIGRAWIAPMGHGVYVLFNSYARSDTWLNQNGSTLHAMASVLCEARGFDQKSVDLNNYGQTSGEMWINNGVGIALYSDHEPKSSIDLQIDIEGQYTCEMCGYSVHEDDAYYVEGYGSVCEDCFCDNFGYCNVCDETYHRDDLTYIDNNDYCDYCRDKEYTLCDHCNNWVENDEAVGDYCQDCFSDHYALCEICDEIVSWDKVRDGVCTDCRNDDKPFCKECGNKSPSGHTCTKERRVYMQDYNGYRRVVCGHDVVVYCAKCDSLELVRDCAKDKFGAYHCQGCRDKMMIDCKVCKIEASHQYAHTDGENHFCLTCWPTLPKMEMAEGIINAS